MTNIALLLIDFQNDYYSTFSDAKYPLLATEAASLNAATLLTKFRRYSLPIIHVRHESLAVNAPFFIPKSEGANIHNSVAAITGEEVIVKHKPNSFKDTRLNALLKELEIEKLLIVGAMSHMCIDATARAAVDFGYECYVAHDACATLDLEFNGIKIPAKHVHYSFMAALNTSYCQVDSTDNLLQIVRG